MYVFRPITKPFSEELPDLNGSLNTTEEAML